MSTFRKQYARTRGVWLYTVPASQLKQFRAVLRCVRPCLPESRTTVRVPGRPDQIREVDHYLALNGWIEHTVSEQLMHELAGDETYALRA